MAIGKFLIAALYVYVYMEYALSEEFDSLSELLQTKEDDGIIKGNPLHLPECANALIEQHDRNLNYLQHLALPNPWFWSRESLSAVTKNMTLKRHSKFTHNHVNSWPSQAIQKDTLISYEYALNHSLIKKGILDWYHEIDTEEENQDDGDKTCFYHIEKSGSSSISKMMLNYGFNTSYMSENSEVHCGCGFTFIRDPISRFVSGYYTIQRLIYSIYSLTKVPQMFKFWNVTGEPQRITQFIEDMHAYSFEFVDASPLEHLMTQSGVLSVSKFDIHYIGDVKSVMDHLEIIINKCGKKTNDVRLLNQELKEEREMSGYGTALSWKLGRQYNEMLSLDHHLRDDLKPAYMAIANNYDLYQKIVEYYKQDYICFGFEHDWNKFRNKIYEKYKKTKEQRKKRKWGETIKGIVKAIQLSVFGNDEKEKNVEIKPQTIGPKPTKNREDRPRLVKRNELERERE